MNYKKVTFKDFIIIGLQKGFLISNKKINDISKKLDDYKYNFSLLYLDDNYKWDLMHFSHVLKQKMSLTTFIKLNNIKLIISNNKEITIDNDIYKNAPPGMFYMKKSHDLISRTKETEILEIILNKKIRSNVLLVGEAGVGKTKLVNNLSKNIMFLDLTSIISGTEYRGSFENKLYDVIYYAMKNHIILFIDEIHSLYNLGLSEGGISALDILKPYLSSGKLSIIGATTPNELTLLNKDKAFKRRFTTILIKPIKKEDILYNLNYILKQVNVNINNENGQLILNKAYKLFGKYRLLDGFLDMLDTINSYCLKYNIKQVNYNVLKKVDFIWEEIY